MTLIHHLMMSAQHNDTKFKIYCHYAQGEGAYQSVTCNKGRGDRDESPFPRRVGGRDESPFTKRGGGTVISHPKGRVPREERGAPPITAKGRG